MQSTESVRDFLIEKIRAAEVALKGVMRENNILKKQALADQEIIAFLDIRGQESEGIVIDLQRECSQLRVSSDIQGKAFQSIESQLRLENAELKRRLEAVESSSRAQKKVLVKEVRILRAQLDQSMGERSRMASQLSMMREVLLGANSNST